MRLTVLGCNGPYPAAAGACSGYLLEGGGARVLLDCGTGVLARLTAQLPPEELDAVVLTHLHYDHVSDMLPLIYRCQAMGKRLRVFLPMQESGMLTLLREGFDMTDIAAGGRIGGLALAALPVRHPVPAYAVRLTDEESKSLCYTGDTNTRPGLAQFAAGADVLLADACFTDALWDEKKPHLSARLAGRLAREAEAKRLVLTHFRPDICVQTLLEEARQEFAPVCAAQAGLTLCW